MIVVSVVVEGDHKLGFGTWFTPAHISDNFIEQPCDASGLSFAVDLDRAKVRSVQRGI